MTTFAKPLDSVEPLRRVSGQFVLRSHRPKAMMMNVRIYLGSSEEDISSDEAKALAKRFESLADEWQRDTGASSLMAAKFRHPAYQQIVNDLGEKAIPLIFSRLRTHGGFWFAALEQLTGEKPHIAREDYGRYSKIRDAWFRWETEKKLR